MSNINKFSKDLVEEILNSKQIFLLPHIYADIDTLSSCFAMGELIKKLGKKAFIVFDDDINTIDDSAKQIINSIKNDINFIQSNELREKQTNNDLYITLDVNKKNLIHVKKFKETDKLIIIDHHNVDKNTLEAKYKYIDLDASSASEIMYDLYKTLSLEFNKLISSCLLAGIYLDTNKLYNVINYKTFIVVAKLIKKGANLKEVQKLFIDQYDKDRKIHYLISKKEDIDGNIGLCVANSNVMYTRAELAKAANYLQRFDFEAVFVIGYIDKNTISISARSNGNINVCEIMSQFDGGGTNISSAAKIENSDIDEVKNKLINILKKEDIKIYGKRY